MNVGFYILKEIVRLVLEDWLFTLIILLWIGAIACLKSNVLREAMHAPLLLIGLLAILLFSVIPAFHRSAVFKKADQKNRTK